MVNRVLHGGWFLAPTTDQQLKYKDYLRVWGKDKVKVPMGLKAAFKEFDICFLFSLFQSQSHYPHSLGARVPRNEWEHFRNIAGTGSIFLHCN